MTRLAVARKRTLVTCMLLALCVEGTLAQVNFTGPQPGDVYREYSRSMPATTDNWRVTDPNVNLTLYPQADPFVPNPVLHLTVGDLQNAIRAEAVISLWGGHIGTYGKKVRFNSHTWIDIPELSQQNGIPEGHTGQCYLNEPTVTVPIPLSDLASGDNTFEGRNAGQTCYGFQWGQHGWYNLMIRVYYDPALKPHPTGFISSPVSNATMTENPTIATSVNGNVSRVDILASYTGYDTDGDGIYSGYHYDYQPAASNENTMTLRNHAGTSTSAPFQATWNTTWVPDQTAGDIKLMAVIRDNTGLSYCTPEVTDLSLGRTGYAVKMYTPSNLGERAWARGDLPVVRCTVTIPPSETVADATAAVYHNRTWNGIDSAREPGETDYRRLNSWTDGAYGGNHFFSYDVRTVPVAQLRQGTNEFSFYSQTTAHHGIEILWPGPALVVKYTGSAYASPTPLTAELASPADAAGDQEFSPVLAWHPTPGGTSYRLQVSSDPTFVTMVFNDPALTDTAQQVNGLSGFTTYYWRVSATGPGGTGPYSPTWSFTTRLAAPSLQSPANSATSVLLPVTLRWMSSPGTGAYKVQLSTDSTFVSGLVVNDSTITDTTRQVSGLSFATRYFWRVKAMVTGGQFSFPWSFTTIVGPAATPVLVSPANGATGLAVGSIDFDWQSAQWATTYRLQIATDPSFATGVAFDDSTITATSKSVTTLHTDRLYYWRVAGKGPGGSGNFSNARSFETVKTIPLAVALISPPNGASNQPVLGLKFDWAKASSATHYGFQLATDSTFVTGFFKNDSALVDTTRIVSGLTLATRYYWRVRARNSAGWGPYSPTWSLMTVVPLPGQISLLGPAAGSIARADSGIFTWQRPTPPATNYWFEIAIDSLFSSFRSIDSTLVDTVKVFRPLLDGQRYYWRVRGGNLGGWGPFSETRVLSVVTSIASRPGLPETYVLEQNHPNPFNPSTTIGFGLPQESQALLEVYNMLGQKVATILDEHLAPGNYSVTFDASPLPSGVYLYRLATPRGSLVHKMILMK